MMAHGVSRGLGFTNEEEPRMGRKRMDGFCRPSGPGGGSGGRMRGSPIGECSPPDVGDYERRTPPDVGDYERHTPPDVGDYG